MISKPTTYCACCSTHNRLIDHSLRVVFAFFDLTLWSDSMSLSTTLSEYICAAFSGLYVHTFEPDEALREIGELCRQRNWRLACWDLDRGLSLGVAAGTASSAVATAA